MKVLLTAASILALGAFAACGELPAESNVVDLRVLAVKSEPAGFLVDLNKLDAATDDQLRAQITALVVDPSGAMMPLEVVGAVGCPDYIDVITTASQQIQTTKLCPPPEATSGLPQELAEVLMTQPIAAPDPNPVPPEGQFGFEWTPTVSYGFTQQQIAAFFRADTSIYPPAVATSIELNKAFGLPAIVNLSFAVNGERVDAIKRVVYWPIVKDGELANKNPTLGDPMNPTAPQIRFYRHRDETTGVPDQEVLEMEPMISIAAGDKLYVEPNYVPGVGGTAESYTINVLNTATNTIEPKMVEKELLRFQFYATAGKFDPEMQFSELNPILVGGTLHTDAEWIAPKDLSTLPAGGGTVTVWLVTHDERAGSDWASRTFIVNP
ncbi:MAG TPA: hypothetical protein VIQ54_28150 [Polyangia bacterium]